MDTKDSNIPSFLHEVLLKQGKNNLRKVQDKMLNKGCEIQSLLLSVSLCGEFFPHICSAPHQISTLF